MSGYYIDSIRFCDFRNLSDLNLSLSPHFNVIYGPNGQGKTNFLEAIYIASTSKSFRNSKCIDWVKKSNSEPKPHSPSPLKTHLHLNDDHFSISDEMSQKLKNSSSKEDLPYVRSQATVIEIGVIDEDLYLKRNQSVSLDHGLRKLRIDSKRPKNQLEYASRTPVVVFHPQELDLTRGPAILRRRLLDRISLYLSYAFYTHMDAYVRAHKERKKCLETYGIFSKDLDSWEELIVSHGMEIIAARERISKALASHLKRNFSDIVKAKHHLNVYYSPYCDEPKIFYEKLRSLRGQDLRRGTSSVGPHRDDLFFELDKLSVRNFASQGQHRAIVLALKSAEMDVIFESKRKRPILLLDDVSSELDDEKTKSLFAFLAEQRGQVFLTTTRPELIPFADGPDVFFFDVHGGMISKKERHKRP